MNRVYRQTAIVVVIASLHLSGCGGLEINSVRSDGDVKIDGIPLDWRGATTWVESPNVTIGVKNDDDYLYLCLSSPVREVAAQIAMYGFTVWLDPEGKKDKTFGIRCPIGAAGGMGNPGDLEKLAQDRDKFLEMVVERLKGAGSVLEILGPDEDDSVRIAGAEASGVDVALGYHDGRVVYELKVPFRRDDEHPYAIGSHGDGRIGVGFETPDISRDEIMTVVGGKRPGGGRGGGPGGGMSGGGTGGRQGRGGTGRGPGAGNTPRAIDIWARIKLAPAGIPG
jgi:hypothetical protein